VNKGSRHFHQELFNLKAAVEREKAVQAIDVYRERNNCVVTLWVMSQFLHFLGMSRGCADFRDPTAVFRFKHFAALRGEFPHCSWLLSDVVGKKTHPSTVPHMIHGMLV